MLSHPQIANRLVAKSLLASESSLAGPRAPLIFVFNCVRNRARLQHWLPMQSCHVRPQDLDIYAPRLGGSSTLNLDKGSRICLFVLA